jgi:hypothetical protein
MERRIVMKRVIDGLLFDTDKATEIGSDCFGYTNDFGHWEAGLYVTKNGRYFLAGSGGPASQYQREVGQNSWVGGSRIDALTEDEAFEWAEDHLDVEVVEAHFGHLAKEA